MNWDLIGHGWAVALLKRHLLREQVRHAYLITGPTSVGKRSLALRFAQALNCERAPEPGEVCGQADCRACQLTPGRNYPDLHFIAPQESIGIDEVRSLQSRLALAPYEGRWRVAVLADFHLATLSAANAMLKVLEEPPSRVVLILTAPNAELLLSTVVSRCERLALRPVSHAEIAAALQERGAGEDQAEQLSILASRRPGVALTLLEDPDRLLERVANLDDLRRLLHMDPIGRFAEVSELLGSGKLPDQRKRVRRTLEHWGSLWRDLVQQAYGTEIVPQNPDQMEQLGRAASQLTPVERIAGLRAVTAARQAVDHNANLRLTLEALMLDLPDLQRRAS